MGLNFDDLKGFIYPILSHICLDNKLEYVLDMPIAEPFTVSSHLFIPDWYDLFTLLTQMCKFVSIFKMPTDTILFFN